MLEGFDSDSDVPQQWTEASAAVEASRTARSPRTGASLFSSSRGPVSSERVVASAFVASAVASVGLVVLYARGGQPQLEGVLLGLALGGLGVGITLWATDLIDAPIEIEERAPLTSAEAEDAPFTTAAFNPEKPFLRQLLLSVGYDNRGDTLGEVLLRGIAPCRQDLGVRLGDLDAFIPAVEGDAVVGVGEVLIIVIHVATKPQDAR